MTRKRNLFAVAVILMIPAAAAWAILIYFCWVIVTATTIILDIITRSQ